MMKIWKILLATLVVFTVVACSGTSERSVDGILSDKLIPVSTEQGRVLRLAAVAVWASEVATDRVLHFDPEDAPLAVSLSETLLFRLTSVDRTEQVWVDTGMFETKRLIILAAEERLKDRVTNLLSSGPLNFSTVTRAADFLGKSDAMLADMNRMFTRVESGEMTEDQAWKALQDRIVYNIQRLRPLMGGV